MIITCSKKRAKKKIENGEITRVGYNKYKCEERPPHMKVVRRTEEMEAKVIAAVNKYKTQRDHGKVKQVLSEVKKAATAIKKDWPNSQGVLMPAMIEAVRGKASLGECCKVLRDVFGFGHFAG